jgi:hypothetical protein
VVEDTEVSDGSLYRLLSLDMTFYGKGGCMDPYSIELSRVALRSSRVVKIFKKPTAMLKVLAEIL